MNTQCRLGIDENDLRYPTSVRQDAPALGFCSFSQGRDGGTPVLVAEWMLFWGLLHFASPSFG